MFVRRRVLLVDRSAAQRRLLSLQLTRAGYQVTEAECAEDALAICRAQNPHFVISDWVMAGISGTDFCRELRKIPRDDYIYFILLTLKNHKNDIACGLESGADEFLSKPVSSIELLARLRAADRILTLQEQQQATNRRLAKTLEKLRSAQRNMHQDLNEARKLQQSLIHDRQAHFGAFDVSLLLRPAGHIGGDLVGYFPINAKEFGMFSLDVSGHGVAAALLTARLAGQLSAAQEQNAAIRKNKHGIYEAKLPSQVAHDLNDLLLKDFCTDTYLTMIYGIVNVQTGDVQMTQAGHPYPMVQRADGRIKRIGTGGMPIGLFEDAVFENLSFRLFPGDRLFIGSDGISEAINRKGHVLGDEGLAAMLTTNAFNHGLALLDSLVLSATRFADGKQDDDMSAVLIEYTG